MLLHVRQSETGQGGARNAMLDIQQGKIIFLQGNDAEGTAVAEDEELLFS
jgi:hypothetical protein